MNWRSAVNYMLGVALGTAIVVTFVVIPRLRSLERRVGQLEVKIQQLEASRK